MISSYGKFVEMPSALGECERGDRERPPNWHVAAADGVSGDETARGLQLPPLSPAAILPRFYSFDSSPFPPIIYVVFVFRLL
jgi:hypothetical protein